MPFTQIRTWYIVQGLRSKTSTVVVRVSETKKVDPLCATFTRYRVGTTPQENSFQLRVSDVAELVAVTVECQSQARA